MIKSIGLSILCLGLLAAGPHQASARSVGDPAGRAMPAALRAASAPQPAAQPKGPQWKSRDEYDAFAAFTKETDAAKQVVLIEAFLQKYSNSDFKNRAYYLEMQDYAKLGKSSNAIDAARQAVKADPNDMDMGYDLEALSYLAYAFPYTYDAKASDAASQLDKGLADAQKGLDLLQRFQKPAGATEVQFEDFVKPKRAFFNTAIGFADLQKKNYADAIAALKKAAQDDPSNNLIFSLIGQAYYYSSPPDYNDAIWFLARSVALAKQAKSPNAAQLEKFYDQVYVGRHCSSMGESDIVTQAATSVDPPQGFSVTAPQKHAPTGDKNVDAFYQNIEDPLTVACSTIQQNWKQLKGQPLGLVGTVASVAPGSDPQTTVVDVDVTPESKSNAGAFDIQLEDSAQPDAKLLRAGDPVQFQGTISAYATNPNFYVTLSGATINDSVLKMAAERAKAEAQGKKRPVRRRGHPGRR